MLYRKEIDGLRAIAVLPVIFFHLNMGIFAGGFLGVDVFFVISGYLITSIIINELERDQFTLANFYERRARRILPALFLVVFVSIPFSYFLMLPSELWNFFQSVTAVSLFSSNVLFFLESDYFELSAKSKPLLHTWSLAVEEQFYILFPIFLILFKKNNHKIILLILIILTIISFIICIILNNLDGNANFFFTPSRSWELFIGSICAYYHKTYSYKQNKFLSDLGLIIVLFSFMIFDKNTPTPSYSTLLPILGCSLIVLFSGPDSISGKFLSNKIWVFIGLISYSLYLWHWPIIVFANLYFFDELNYFHLFALFSLTFFISYYSWKYVEKPFRNYKLKNIFSRNFIFISSSLIIFILSGLGVWGHYNKGFAERNFIKTALIQPVIDVPHHAYLQETIMNGEFDGLNNNSFSNQANTRKFLVIGDSHAVDIFNALYLNKDLFTSSEFRIRQLNFNCFQYNSRMNSFMVKVPILGQIYFSSKNKIFKDCAEKFFKKEELILKSATDIIFSNRWLIRPDPFKILDQYALPLKNLGKKIYVASNTEEFEPHPPEIIRKLAKKIEYSKQKQFPLDVANKKLFEIKESNEVPEINTLLFNYSKEKEMSFLEKKDLLCNYSKEICYSSTNDNKSVYFDYGHWTLDGAKYIGKKIYDKGWFNIN